MKEFDSVIDLIVWLINPPDEEAYYYRGVDMKDQIYPKIMRIKNNKHNDNINFCEIEDNLLDDFIKYGSSLIGNNTNAFTYLAFAQHYGLPTRLVDWSSNPLVALFFAIYYSNRQEKNPELLLLPRNNTIPIREPVYFRTWSDGLISDENPIRSYFRFRDDVRNNKIADLAIYSGKEFSKIEDNDKVYSNKIKSNDKKGCMIMIDPGRSNPRVITQSGLFYFPRELNREEIDKEMSASGVKYIPIRVGWRDELNKLLKNLGIEKWKLFLDLPEICSYIVEENVEFYNLMTDFDINRLTLNKH